jgi:hypothetical protein
VTSRRLRRTGDDPAWVYRHEKMGRMAHDSKALILDTRPRSGAEGGMPYEEGKCPRACGDSGSATQPHCLTLARFAKRPARQPAGRDQVASERPAGRRPHTPG